jgi:hypothetical protein
MELDTSTQNSNSILEYLREDLSLPSDPATLSQRYRQATPFPHLLFNNMFDDHLVGSLVEEISAISQTGWALQESNHQRKVNLRSAVDLGVYGRRYVDLVHSAAFLYLLSEITGIWGLVPDPYLSGAGYTLIPNGGFFDVHADRNYDHQIGLTRRLSMITYLNRDWNPGCGGQLELWNTSGTQCESVIEPLFNTTILFEIGDRNFHAIRKVATPQGITRNAFVSYYHTAPEANGNKPHTSLFAPAVYKRGGKVKEMISGYLIPPKIGNAIFRLRKSLGTGGR